MTAQEKELYEAMAATNKLLQSELSNEKNLNMKLQRQVKDLTDLLDSANKRVKELEEKSNATA